MSSQLILFLDLETDGLLPKWYEPQRHIHIVQMSYQLVEFDGMEAIIVLNDFNAIVRVPDGVVIPEEAFNIHKISTQMSLEMGTQLEDTLPELFECIAQADLIVAHNANFDFKVLELEMDRLLRDVPSQRSEILEQLELLRRKCYSNFTGYCTMQASTNLCKLPFVTNGRKPPVKAVRNVYKYPKLIELCMFLFGFVPVESEMHNSSNDVLICILCFFKLKYGIDIRSSDAGFHEKLLHLIPSPPLIDA